MSENIFEKEFLDAQKNLDKQRRTNQIVKFFTLGIFNTEKQVAKYERLLSESRKVLDDYNEICERTNILEKSKVVEELPDVRIGGGTDTGIKVIGGEDYGKDWEIIREAILTRDSYQCQESDGYCSGALQVHHITPLTKGGSNDSHNLITLCLYHHSLKHEHMKGDL